jgi:NADH dehydrogenase
MVRVVIVGGGFGGLYAARSLRRAPVEVTLVDRRNFHLFQPLLYQVATGGLSPADIASPLRSVLRAQPNVTVLLGEVTDFDVAGRRLILSDGELHYDLLIVAAGSRHHYFGNEQWAAVAPGLKTIEDATEIRRRLLLAFETAEREPHPSRRAAWMTFVVVGGGPTGVELAGAVAEIARDTLRKDFRSIDARTSRILLLEGMAQVLPSYPAALAARAKASLERLGVGVRLETRVVDVGPSQVTVRGAGGEERIATRTVLWAAGVRADALAERLSRAAGSETDPAGRLIVEPDLTLPGHPEILVIGDMAHFRQDGAPLPALAPVAMAEGRYAARVVRARILGREPAPFRYRDKGTMATIGRSHAVADLGWLRFSGFPAWLVWLFVHLMYLVEFENRLLVLIQWAWSYFTRNRGARLITGASPLPLDLSRSGRG